MLNEYVRKVTKKNKGAVEIFTNYIQIGNIHLIHQGFQQVIFRLIYIYFFCWFRNICKYKIRDYVIDKQ